MSAQWIQGRINIALAFINDVGTLGINTMKQAEAGMTRDKPGRLSRRDFLGVAGLVTATLGLQAGLALAPIQAEASINEEPAPANLWERLGALMLDEMQPDSSLYAPTVCGFHGHPVGCACCL